MEIVPEFSKYVKGGYVQKKYKSISAIEDYIDELSEKAKENVNTTEYFAPIVITDTEGNLIPVPSENTGRYSTDPVIKKKDLPKNETLNLYNVSSRNGTGIIKRGMHIKYIRNNPRNFVKGGFITHINSTYITFRYARGSSAVQIADIDVMYLTSKPKKPKKEVKPIKIKLVKPKKKVTFKLK